MLETRLTSTLSSTLQEVDVTEQELNGHDLVTNGTHGQAAAPRAGELASAGRFSDTLASA